MTYINYSEQESNKSNLRIGRTDILKTFNPESLIREIIDLKLASESAHAAIMAAEESSDVRLENVYLAQSGGHLHGTYHEGSVNIMASNNRVTSHDMERAIKDAKGKELESDRVYIHHIQNPFKIDGNFVDDPLGMEGQKLSVGYWSVDGDLNRVKNCIHVINSIGIKVEDMIISSIASASMVTDKAQKSNGVIVLDIGRGCSDFCVYCDGYIVQTGVIPVGGDHITNDISLGLGIENLEAEQLKKEYGQVNEVDEDQDLIDVFSEGKVGESLIKRSVLQKIIYARVEELFILIKKIISQRVMLKDILAGIIITGGTSRLEGIEGLGCEVFGIDVRLGENPYWTSNELRDPEYSTVLGLLHYALRGKGDSGQVHVKRQGFLKRVAKIFNIA